jgi:hypothetical protein
MLGYMWRQRKRVLGQVDRKEKWRGRWWVKSDDDNKDENLILFSLRPDNTGPCQTVKYRKRSRASPFPDLVRLTGRKMFHEYLPQVPLPLW